MIEILIKRDGQGKIVYCEITGHAGYSDYGKDIVCAAVSAIAQTALLGVKELTGAKVEESVRPGNFALKVINVSTDDRVKLDGILETMVLGLKDIAGQYSRYVKIVDRRCEG
ncbi:ribosomal-processing cysteine protease Prp [Caldanaerobius polysaccharolyticus]|uniref:ribosomal-processing cysteine protease Prp n=1 Tax=Caldanaerobius polysaccharolyticus TaxID=44256 RepID=UPI00047DDA24|nr:ribosomal-processing cysteine protease Prp [Caldanaerobius polysaccharolyticus]